MPSIEALTHFYSPCRLFKRIFVITNLLASRRKNTDLIEQITPIHDHIKYLSNKNQFDYQK
jgi:hypothetical protein